MSSKTSDIFARTGQLKVFTMSFTTLNRKIIWKGLVISNLDQISVVNEPWTFCREVKIDKWFESPLFSGPVHSFHTHGYKYGGRYFELIVTTNRLHYRVKIFIWWNLIVYRITLVICVDVALNSNRFHSDYIYKMLLDN